MKLQVKFNESNSTICPVLESGENIKPPFKDVQPYSRTGDVPRYLSQLFDDVGYAKQADLENIRASIGGALEALPSAISEKISSLVFEDTPTVDNFVDFVNQTNGVISVHRSPLPVAAINKLGMVQPDDESLSVNGQGIIGVKAVNVNKLYVADVDEFILDCGNAN